MTTKEKDIECEELEDEWKKIEENPKTYEESEDEYEKNIEKELKKRAYLYNLIRDIQKMGVIGEENTILVLIIKICLRLVKNSKPTSSNCWLSDNSGVGKDAVMGAVTRYMLKEEDLVHRTNFSKKALEYWGRPEKNTVHTKDFDGKVVYLEDPNKECINSDAMRALTAGKLYTTTVIDGNSVDLKFEGKPVILATSMQSNLDIEGGRRWDNLELDKSQRLTEIYLENILSDEEKPKINEKLRHGVRNLKPYIVRVPYKRHIKVKSKNIGIRTNIHRLLDYIRASAVLNQKVRATDEKGRLIANSDDYFMGVVVYSILKNIKETPALGVGEREVVRAVKKLEYHTDFIGKGANNQEKQYGVEASYIIKETGKSTVTIYKILDNLLDKGILRPAEVKPRDFEGRKPRAYKRVAEHETQLTKVIDILANYEAEYSLNLFKDLFNINPTGENDPFLTFLAFLSTFKTIDYERQKKGLKPLFTNFFSYYVKKVKEVRITEENKNEKRVKKGLKKGLKSPLVDTTLEGCFQ